MPLDITPTDVEGMKVTELKDALTALGLSTKGVKKELAARLLEGIAAQSSESGAAAEAPPAEEAAPPPAEPVHGQPVPV